MQLGRTPLHYAAQRGFRDIVILLVEAGSKATMADKEFTTPVDLAAKSGHSDIELLLRGS